mmetsp:Transcript_21005/g.53743  ORF Transcript_21005/g.53743 Transcript_21005/m.53743 type:complete len:217 (-) Transcript_21005:142-792(-)
MLVHQEAVCDDLGEQLDGEDGQVEHFAQVDEAGLPCSGRIERRLPCHCHAVHQDHEEDERIERPPLHEEDGGAPRQVGRAQAAERRAVVYPAAGSHHLEWRLIAKQCSDRRRPRQLCWPAAGKDCRRVDRRYARRATVRLGVFGKEATHQLLGAISRLLLRTLMGPHRRPTRRARASRLVRHALRVGCWLRKTQPLPPKNMSVTAWCGYFTTSRYL